MDKFTALIIYLALFLIAPYVTTIVYLRLQRIYIRFAKEVSVGMEIACFLPMILATHVLSVKITPLVDKGIVWIGDLMGRDWVGAFSGQSYLDTFVHLFKDNTIGNISHIKLWLDLFFLVFIVHFIATMILAWKIDRELNWASQLQSIKSNPNTRPLSPIVESIEAKFRPKKPMFGLIALEWLRSFGIWNELNQDLSYRDTWGSEVITLDVCLDNGGEVIYQGILDEYSDSGGFTGIIMRDVQVKRNSRISCDNQGTKGAKPRHFEMLLQYPDKPELADKKRLSRLFISMGDIKTLNRRLQHFYEEDESQERAFKDGGAKAFEKEDKEVSALTGKMKSVFGFTEESFKKTQKKTD